jgi:hypothetical protein
MQKGELHAALKQLHGQHWLPGMKPIYDERGFAAIIINRFDASVAPTITRYPAIHWLELRADLGNRPATIRQMIPPLLEGCARHLEFLEISNILDLFKSTERMRDVLPEDPGPFGRLPAIREVVFDRVNVTDRLVQELCSNRRLESLDIREASITQRVVKHLAACKRLKYVLLTRCPNFAPSAQEKLRARLSDVPYVRVS